MTPKSKKWIQIVLTVVVLFAAARTAYIFYERRVSTLQQAAKQGPPLNPDYYVIPKKLYAYDLKSARALTQQPVWVKEGYRYSYYPYDAARHRSDFNHEGGQLLPLQKLEIKDVVLDVPPGLKGQKQVMAVFSQDNKSYALPVGTERGGDFRIYADEVLFIQDPKELYKHWSAQTWESIDKHEAKLGMNELQAVFAIGMGIPERSNDPDVKTVNYPNGGKPLTIIYRDGKAVEIKPKPNA
jgi:hypothetical protein